MKELITKKVVDRDGDEYSLLEYLKQVVTEILINEPPKSFLGDSDWQHVRYAAFAKGGVLSGGVEPCCEDWKDCGGDEPCGFVASKSIKDHNKEMRKLIDYIFDENNFKE